MPNRLGVARTLPRLPVLITMAGFVPATVCGPVRASPEAIAGTSAATTKAMIATRRMRRRFSADMSLLVPGAMRALQPERDSQSGGLVQELDDAPLQLRDLRQLLQGAPPCGAARRSTRARRAERRRSLEPRRGARQPEPGPSRADARPRRRTATRRVERDPLVSRRRHQVRPNRSLRARAGAAMAVLRAVPGRAVARRRP